MVHITKKAAAFLEEKRRRHILPRSHVIRLYSQAGPRDLSGPLAMTFVADPEDGDQKVVEHGVRLFVAAGIKKSLEGLVIDTHEHQPHKLRLRKQKTTGQLSPTG
jgi:Fe-S cluster assembly iron-binding protein IscA